MLLGFLDEGIKLSSGRAFASDMRPSYERSLDTEIKRLSHFPCKCVRLLPSKLGSKSICPLRLNDSSPCKTTATLRVAMNDGGSFWKKGSNVSLAVCMRHGNNPIVQLAQGKRIQIKRSNAKQEIRDKNPD